jgi:hypothetical protein
MFKENGWSTGKLIGHHTLPSCVAMVQSLGDALEGAENSFDVLVRLVQRFP